MSDQIDSNRFRADVEQALQRIEKLPEEADEEPRKEKLQQDQKTILEYIYDVEDSLAPGILRIRIDRLRILAKHTESPLEKIESKTAVITLLERLSRRRMWESPETKRAYIKVLTDFYRFHGKSELPDELNEYVRENLSASHIKEIYEERKNKQFESLLANATTSRERAILSTLWEGAYREKEFRALKIGDYESQGDTHAFITSPNNIQSKVDASSPRKITYSKGYIDQWLETDHPCPEDEDAALFCERGINFRRAGEPLTYRQLHSILKNIAERTEIPNLASKIGSSKLRRWRLDSLKQNDDN